MRLSFFRVCYRGVMVALRGRRQVGKSRLVEEFLKRSRVPAVFYTASRQDPARELEIFSHTHGRCVLRGCRTARIVGSSVDAPLRRRHD